MLHQKNVVFKKIVIFGQFLRIFKEVKAKK